MAEPNAPKGPILTERLLVHGESAELKDQRIDLNRERAYVRRLTTTDRMQLQQNMEAWKKKNETDQTATAVLSMLHDLKRDVAHEETYSASSPEPLAGQRTGLDWMATKGGEAALGQPIMNAVEGYKEIPRYVRDEAKRFGQAEGAEKVGIAVKGAIAVVGVGMALKLMHWLGTKGADKISPKGGMVNTFLHGVKWLAMGIGLGTFANWMLNKGTRPPLAPNTPTTSNDRKADTVRYPGIPENRNLLDDVALDDARKQERNLELDIGGKKVLILPPVNDAGKFELQIRVDNVPYRIVPIVDAGQKPNGVEDVIGSIFQQTNGDGRATLAIAKRFVGVHRTGNVVSANIFGAGGIDVDVSEIERVVGELKGQPATDVSLQATFRNGIAGTATVENRRFRVERTDGVVLPLPAPAAAPAQTPAAAPGGVPIKPFEGPVRIGISRGPQGVFFNVNDVPYAAAPTAAGTNTTTELFDVREENGYMVAPSGLRYTKQELVRVARLLAGSEQTQSVIGLSYEVPVPGTNEYQKKSAIIPFMRMGQAAPAAAPAAPGVTPLSAPPSANEPLPTTPAPAPNVQPTFPPMDFPFSIDGVNAVLTKDAEGGILTTPNGKKFRVAETPDTIGWNFFQGRQNGQYFEGMGFRINKVDVLGVMMTLDGMPDAQKNIELRDIPMETRDPSGALRKVKQTMRFDRL